MNAKTSKQINPGKKQEHSNEQLRARRERIECARIAEEILQDEQREDSDYHPNWGFEPQQ